MAKGRIEVAALRHKDKRRNIPTAECQTAWKRDPGSASNRDPSGRWFRLDGMDGPLTASLCQSWLV
jgi:hypothetical protein